MRRSVLWDSSAILALLDADDADHQAASGVALQLATNRRPSFITNYIEVETHALLLRKLGRTLAREWLMIGTLPIINQGAARRRSACAGNDRALLRQGLEPLRCNFLRRHGKSQRRRRVQLRPPFRAVPSHRGSGAVCLSRFRHRSSRAEIQPAPRPDPWHGDPPPTRRSTTSARRRRDGRGARLAAVARPRRHRRAAYPAHGLAGHQRAQRGPRRRDRAAEPGPSNVNALRKPAARPAQPRREPRLRRMCLVAAPWIPLLR